MDKTVSFGTKDVTDGRRCTTELTTFNDAQKWDMVI